MNASECDSLIKDVEWSEPSSILLLVVLLVIDLIVIIGNCLVVAAVYMSSKLRTVTNLFIVSLAVADLMVGIAVLPFSATLESFKVWVFGDIWCSIWLAVDVWMCTASILNLCAISLDRYVAVTRPVNYPSIMSSHRAKYLIAAVWVLSFVICFPPLVGWKDSKILNGSVRGAGTAVPSFGTVRFHGAHTVITTIPSVNITESGPFQNFLRHRTNFSEHLFNSIPEGMKSKEAEIETEFVDDYLKTDSYTEQKTEVKRSLSAFSGVPIVSADLYDFRNDHTDPPGLKAEIEQNSESDHCPWICELTSDPGYVIYSALGSFFIPMAVMLFFYWRIYRAAVLTTRAINQGFRTTKGGSGGGFGNRFDEQRLTLRIHRGRGSVQNHGSTCSSTTNLTTTNGGHTSLSASPSSASTGKSPDLQRLSRMGSKDNKHEQVKISVSYPSSDQINALPPSEGVTSLPRSSDKSYLTPTSRRSSCSSPKKTAFASSPPRRSLMDLSPKRMTQNKGEMLYSVHFTNKNGRDITESSLCKTRDPNCYLRVSGPRITTSGRNSRGQRSPSIDSTNSLGDDEPTSRRNSTKSQNADDADPKELRRSTTFDESNIQKQKVVPKMGKRNIKAQVKRFRMETKAAKTLAIIVGGFILCWMPFFTLYLVRAFCQDCINPVIFSLLFWLGYCNSAINPCIYALFSKDFRFAFKKIICRCLCGKDQPMNLMNKRRGSDGSTIKTPVHERRKSCSYNPPNSLGEDSDPGASDSR